MVAKENSGANGFLEVGNRKQLFIDERFIDQSENVELTMNPPYMSEEPVLVPDRPWEERIGGYNTVIREGDRFRMWYDFTPPDDDPSGITRGVAYAESSDGIHWEKPDIGLVEMGGTLANNIVIPRLPDAPRGETEGGTVLLDTNPDCPEEERYKFWTKIRDIHPEDEARGMTGPFWQMYSSDGIYWNTYPDRVDAPQCDTQNVPFWDDRLGKYVGYGRTRNPYMGFRVRGIGRIESTDFHDWSEMVEVYRAEASEWRFSPPAECAERLGGYVDVYTNAACKYPDAEDVYLMLPSFLYHWECVEVVRGEGDEAGDMHVNYPDTSDIRLLTSRDGVSWEQAPGRRPFLRVGLKGGSRSRQLYTAPGFVRVGDSLWNYCSGSNRNHSGQFDPESDGIKYGIYVNESRLDGFISADTPYEGGWLVTPPITFEGGSLELNVDTSAGGTTSVEVQTADGSPIDGFSREDCDTINGNSTRMQVTYRGSADFSDLAGKALRLRIEAYDAKLYAFQFK